MSALCFHCGNEVARLVDTREPEYAELNGTCHVCFDEGRLKRDQELEREGVPAIFRELREVLVRR